MTPHSINADAPAAGSGGLGMAEGESGGSVRPVRKGEPFFAIDPGNEFSAFVAIDGSGSIVQFGKLANAELMTVIGELNFDGVIEMVACYGMAVGREVFETVYWVGRFAEAIERCAGVAHRMYRREVKLHHCNSVKAKDGNIRQAIIDRYGGKDKAIGKKANPGPLYGISADVWQALALGLTYLDAPEKVIGGNP